MIRLTDIVLICIAVGGAVWTYQIKHEAEISAKHMQSMRAQIAAQKRKIALLEADWALAIAPDRLEKLAKRYEKQLELTPLESGQITNLSELPALKIERLDENEPTYANRDHSITTGGIGALIEKAEGLEQGEGE